MPKQVPCLWLTDHAEPAARFYSALFPNSRVTHVNGAPGQVMSVSFELDGQEYMVLNGASTAPTEAISIQIFCADQEEADHYWFGLTADGGQESQCGWLKDRFGVSWQVIPAGFFELVSDPDPERSQRAVQAMMQMRRLDVAELQRAVEGTAAV